MPPQHEIDRLWPGYLAGGYFDADGSLKPEFVDRRRVAPLVQAMARAKLTNHQLRRFFQHARGVEAKLRSRRVTWPSLLPTVRMLDIAASDAAGKIPPKVPPLFHDFIARNIAAVGDERDFLDGFLPHFEALVGFGSAYVKDERR